MFGNLKKVLGYLLIGTTFFNLSAPSAKADSENECEKAISSVSIVQAKAYPEFTGESLNLAFEKSTINSLDASLYVQASNYQIESNAIIASCTVSNSSFYLQASDYQIEPSIRSSQFTVSNSSDSYEFLTGSFQVERLSPSLTLTLGEIQDLTVFPSLSRLFFLISTLTLG